MTKVFISYAHEDIKAAIRLYLELKAVGGIEPWIDKECLQPGIRWRPAVRKAIRESDFFVALLSKHSTSRKGFVHHELSDALEIYKEFPDDEVYLIPIRLDDCKMPFDVLSEIQYVDFFPNWSKGLERVLAVLNSKQSDVAVETKKETKKVSSTKRGYNYRVGIADLGIGLTNLPQIAQQLNSVQSYFHFTCPTLPSTRNAVHLIDGFPNLAVYEIPNSFFTEHQYLSVDLVACLTRYPLAFEEDDHIVYNYFSGPSEKDERFMFISTDLLYEFTKRAGCTFEKGIAYIIVSQLVVYFTDWGYHHLIQSCVMDFCQNREDMVKGLTEMRFCSFCNSMIQNYDLKEALEAILNDDMKM